MKGGVLTLRQDVPSGTDGLLYYAGLAFVAGFSQRAAQVVVDTGERALGGKTDRLPRGARQCP